MGYCESSTRFSSKGIIISSYNWQTTQTKIEFKNIETPVYDSLINSINFNDLQNYNENLGCGDCADGGKEWITISENGKSKNLFGTYGFKSPKCLGGLLNYIREVN